MMRADVRHLSRSRVVLAMAFCACITACGGDDSPTAPGPAGYQGEWSGTTSQGRPITFTVSATQKVTAISIGYSFSGCSGTNTFANLNLDIVSTATTPAAFGYGSGPPDGPDYMQVYGSFSSSTAATGTIIFSAFAGCGNTVGLWSATRR